MTARPFHLVAVTALVVLASTGPASWEPTPGPQPVVDSQQPDPTRPHPARPGADGPTSGRLDRASAPRRTPATVPHGQPATPPHPRPSLVTAAARTDGEAVRAALPAVALAIRWCESRDDYQAENPTSSASGAWQFIDSTWTWVTGLQPPASAYPRHVQDAAFLALWDDGRGATHWNASRACWAPLTERS